MTGRVRCHGAAAISMSLILLALSGCASLPWPFSRADGMQSGFTQQDLAGELGAYASRFAAGVGNAASDVQAASRIRAVRRRALVWRLTMPPLVDEVAFDDSPQFAYYACLLIATAQRRYLVEGDGRDLFAEQQPIAVETAKLLVDDVLAIGERFLTRSQLRDLQAKAEDFAARYPIQGRDFSVQRIPRALVRAESTQSIGWLLTLPLAPFQALQGVDSGADAIHDFNRTAQQFTQIVRSLPERLRNEIELLLYDVEDRDTIIELLASVDRVATSAETASGAVDRLPEDLRKALLESQGTVDAVGRVVEQANAVAAPLADTAASIEGASAQWLAILGPRRDEPPDPSARPFDVRDWQQTAASVGTAAAELRGLAAELQTLSGASSSLDRAIDRAFWRGAALILLFFVALLGYRVLAARLTRAP